MDKQSTNKQLGSRELWDNLEGLVRSQVQTFVQVMLEEEVTELLGRVKSARRAAVDEAPAYRNGHGKPRKLSMTCGTIEVKRPRVRGLEERFESKLLPLFKRRTKEVGEMLPQLYLHGLAQGDFELALRGLLGDGAPLSASSIERLRERWRGEFELWRQRSLKGIRPVYLWADGVYVKAGLEKDKAALLVVIAGLEDGRKMVVAVEAGHRESEASWSALLRSLRDRGMTPARLMVADGHLGIWSALANVFPETAEQRCWNHKIRNVMDRLPKRAQEQARELLTSIPYSETYELAERRRDEFAKRFGTAWPEASATLERDWDRMTTFYALPQEHWKHLRTTNIVESPFAAVRLRTDASKRFKRVANASALIWKLLCVAEKNFRRLDHPEILPAVAAGALYANGRRLEQDRQVNKSTDQRERVA